MIKCSFCQHSNVEGNFYCEECGTPLILPDGTQIIGTSATQKLTKGDGQDQPLQKQQIWSTTYLKSDTVISLHFIENDTKLDLPNQEDVVFGRSDDRSNTHPDVDLTPHGAVDKGISRTHALIRRKDDTVTVIDLESVNGTFLNGQRILPHQPRILRDGDEVRFGKLSTRVYFK